MLLLPLLLLFFYSCDEGKEYKEVTKITVEDFGDPIYLTGVKMEFDDPVLKPFDLIVHDSILLVYGAGTEKHIHKFNMNTLKKMGESISFGSGPDEMLRISGKQIVDSILWLFDKGPRHCFKYSLSDISLNDNPQILKRISFDMGIDRLVVLPSGKFAGTIFDINDNRLSFFDNEGVFEKSTGDYPSWGKETTILEKMEGFVPGVLSAFNRIYLFCQGTDLFEIYDLEGNLLKRVHGPDHFFPHVKENTYPNGMTKVSYEKDVSRDAYYSPQQVGDEIYVLYSGNYFSSNSSDEKIKRIFVFDPNGKPLRRYELSDCIFNYVVDQSRQAIYGITDYPEFEILKFPLP